MTVDPLDQHLSHDHIAAIFADRDAAEGAVVALRDHGFGSEHLGVAVHDANPVDFEHDAEAETLHGAAVGVATGAPLGAVAGVAIAALVATGVGAIGVGGVLAMGAATGIWGGLFGGYLGMRPGQVGWTEHQDFGFVGLEPGESMIVVCSHGEPDAVRNLMTESGGRLISMDTKQS